MSTYIITGASRGLGLEFVKQIAARSNTTIFACARNPDSSEGLRALIDNKRVFGIKLDVNDASSIEAATQKITENAPEGVDVLINNAGITGTAGLNPETTSTKEYLDIFNTNFCGLSEATKAFLPLMRKCGQDKTKKILNMSSMLGSIANMQDGNGLGFGSAYCVSKAAVNMLTKMTANMLAKENFIVYASHPGWVATDMGGTAAPLTPQESIEGQLNIIDNLSEKDNGAFIDYDGSHRDW